MMKIECPDHKTVSIHQPNYLPWLGYFHKITKADVFVFLDDVQFSKGSYTNRVQILANGTPRWLTIPVTSHLGDPINQVTVANASWAQSHLDTLYAFYRAAPEFKSVWPRLRAIIEEAPKKDIAICNRYIIELIAAELGLSCRFAASSEFGVKDCTGDDRLIRLARTICPAGTYLSGSGGAKYQDERKFAESGIECHYANFKHPTYYQKSNSFVAGLSVVDAVFHIGWNATSELVQGNARQ